MAFEAEKLGLDSWQVIKMLRHGKKGPDGFLAPEGIEQIAAKGYQDGVNAVRDYTRISATGSDAESKNDSRIPRAMHSAQIYATQFNAPGTTKLLPVTCNHLLSFENLKTPEPLDYLELKKSILNSEAYQRTLKADGSKAAERFFDTNVVQAYLSCPDQTFTRELAGKMAAFVLQQESEFEKEVSEKTSANARPRIVIVAGTHSPNIDFLVTEALGVETCGKTCLLDEDNRLNAIGGAHIMGESYQVIFGAIGSKIQPDIRLMFEQGSARRNHYKEAKLFLDRKKLNELSGFYESLHA